MDVSTFAITIKEVISALVMTTISLAVTTKHVLVSFKYILFKATKICNLLPHILCLSFKF